MSSSVSAILAVLFISATLVSSRIHQTADSIVIEVDDVEPKSGERKERYLDPVGRFIPFLLPVSDDALLKNVMKYQSIGVPANTILVKEQPDECWMPDGRYGLCGPVRSCHPHDQLQEPHNPESRMLPSRNVCRYVSNNGKVDTGVCCPRASLDLNGVIPWLYHPFLPPIALYNVPAASPSATWPWWVPDATPTTESPPSKTSPWWVPDTTTSASPFSTSSPWWVPDNTTTSPWWVPETSSTTPSPPSSSPPTTTSSLPGTTSPWWVPEVSSTTASSSSTTSPWWVPETSSTTPSPPSSSPLVTQPPSTTTTSPSTTSPWWVPETSSAAASPPSSSASTTTSLPSTTSPWWVAETPSTTVAPPSTTRPAVSSTLKLPSVSSTTAQTTIATTTASSSGVQAGFKCGTGPYRVFHTDDTQRIVGGVTSVKNAWPFAVSLMAKGRHFCGGSLVDNQHILTAAHCVATLSSNEIAGVEVILGLHTLKPMDAQVVRRKLRRVVRHKGYHAANFFNDIAILKMDSPVQFSNTISPVCLPSDGTTDLFVNRDAVVVGWGALQEDGKLLPISLQEVTVKVQTNAECQKSYENDAPGGIHDSMLCAAYPKKDSCMGDSGGPLVIQTSPGSSWTQVGIVSWGIGCGRAEFPGVYVRTTSFTEWIQKNLSFKK